MSNSKYEYVKDFEIHSELLKNTFIIVRIDGKGFTKFCDLHKYEKPNDKQGIELMVLAGLSVMESFDEIFIGYGQSDEFSFAFRKDAELYNRRAEKILTNVVSTFSCAYVFYWNKIFPNKELKGIPGFDGRIILYPSYKNLRDYFSWRQVDCHINNLYNTTFWALVQQGGISNDEAHKKLMKTFSKDKNEILHSQFNINYNNLPDIYKKGTTLFRNNFNFAMISDSVKSQKNKKTKKNKKQKEENLNEASIEILKEKIINLDIEDQGKCPDNIQMINSESKKEQMEIFKSEILNDVKNPQYDFSFSENFLKIYKSIQEKNIELTNEDIIQDNFWIKNNFVKN